ncbi:hypothetical protein [Leptotrichia hofstadii]|uniref:hypothetical protein n=1 Tax=Leptotrichia hofstadii TaxID=157688 RepID=UPI00156271E2|nr:hypothetical protein [Leptotrichia hofstadii]
MRRFCKMSGYKLKEVIQDVESGGNDNREGFLKLQQEIKRNHLMCLWFTRVLVFHV